MSFRFRSFRIAWIARLSDGVELKVTFLDPSGVEQDRCPPPVCTTRTPARRSSRTNVLISLAMVPSQRTDTGLLRLDVIHTNLLSDPFPTEPSRFVAPLLGERPTAGGRAPTVVVAVSRSSSWFVPGMLNLGLLTSGGELARYGMPVVRVGQLKNEPA